MLKFLKILRWTAICLIVLMTSGAPKVFASFDSPTIYEQLNWYWYRSGGTLAACASTDPGGTPVGSDNRGIAYSYFIGQGFSNIQAAGIVGNLDEESGVNPHTNQTGGGAGRGIAQWSVDGRWKTLLDQAQQQNKDPYDLLFQLSFITYELQHGYETVEAHVKSATSLDDAVNQWMGPNNLSGQPVSVTDPSQRSGGYENPGEPHGDVRLKDAQKVLDDFVGGAPGLGSSACVTSVNCSDPSLTSLSSTRKSVVCTAENELARWQTSSPPKYTLYTDGRAEDWCADFVSWVYKTAGSPFAGGPQGGGWDYPSVSGLANDMPRNNPGYTNHTDKSYVPKPGDIAIHGTHHTNLVIAVSGDVVTLIGGNQDNSDFTQSVVSKRTQGTWDDTASYVSPD